MRISADGRTANINTARIDPAAKEAMAARAEKLLRSFARPAPDGENRPLMGWSSWNTFAVDISEEIIVGVAQAMATNGLKDAGYVYVNIDDGFFNGHGEDGRLRFHPTRFPEGMKGTVDRIHALGMKAGTYSEAGSNTCGSIWNDDAGGVGAGLYGHDAADCKLFFNELEFDFIKVDYCGAGRQNLVERERYGEIYKAIVATGRKVRFNVCRWAFPGTWVIDIAGSWRTTRDIRANWKSIRDIINESLYLSAYAKPGHYNDLDMLEVGQLVGNVTSAFGKHGDTGITRDEEITHFGMWCIMSSPLLLGCDVRKMPAETMSLVANPCLLAMNQNDLGLQAYVAARYGDAYVLVKDADELYGRARYVAVYNSGDADRRCEVNFRMLDLDGSVSVFDLVKRADIGEYENRLALEVPAHSSRFFRLDAEKRLERSVYEAECAYLSAYQEIKDYRKAGTAAPVQTAKASGGVAVVNLGGSAGNDLIWKDVTVFSDGKRKLSIRHAAEDGRGFFVQIDGGAPIAVKPEKSAYAFAVSTVEAELKRGTHTVRLFNPDAPMPDIDMMSVR
jgi:hypothetical protein